MFAQTSSCVQAWNTVHLTGHYCPYKSPGEHCLPVPASHTCVLTELTGAVIASYVAVLLSQYNMFETLAAACMPTAVILPAQGCILARHQVPAAAHQCGLFCALKSHIQLLLHALTVTFDDSGCQQQRSDLIVPAVAGAVANCHKEVPAGD
jgi:hypothetical protein